MNTHDFPDPKLGKVAPSWSLMILEKTKGWVTVGISADTAEFAVNTTRTRVVYKGQKHQISSLQQIVVAATATPLLDYGSLSFRAFADQTERFTYVISLPVPVSGIR